MTASAVLRSLLLACFTTAFFLPALSQSVTVSPTSVAFGNQAEGTISSVAKVTLKNGQRSAITLTSLSTSLSDYGETNNCPISPATLAAGASCTISITFKPGALGTRNGTLTVVDSGTSSPQTVTLTGTGTSPILQSIAVTPSTPSVIAGYTQQFTATGTYSDGSTQNLTSSAIWSSSSNSIATVSTAGLATGVAAGTSTITTKSGTISGSTKLTVTAPILTSISVTPASPSVAAGKTQQFTATGTYSNGTTQNLTSSATWSSSSTTIATIKAGGLATTVAVGTSTITAKSGTISGSTTLTVIAATLTSIAVTPASPSIAAGKTQQFTATGTYSNGTTQNLTSAATWNSGSTSIATVSIGGLATGVATGSSTITATSGTVSGSTKLTVTAAVLTSISVTPATVSVAAGYTQQFTATGTYSNGTTQNLTSSATWSSSKTSVATVKSTTGLATTVAPGTATISAKSGTISGSATLTVTAAVLASISITPTAASLAAGYTQQYTATGTYSNGTTHNLTSTASWISSATSVATVSAGLATAVSQGTAAITATSGTVNGSATLTVTPAVLTSIGVTPGSASIAAGNTQQFTATGTYSNSTTQNLTSTASWNSSASSVASVSGGLAAAIAQGATTITASSGTISGSATLTVTTPVLTSLVVTPATPSIAKGTNQQFTATGTYSDGSMQNLTSSASWSSSSPIVATILAGGLATGEGVGTSTISATSGSITASTTLSVGQPTLISLAVTPSNPSFALGTTLPLVATGTYSDGSTLVLTTSANWTTADSTIATVNSQGTASSVALGNTTATASVGSISGSTTLTITPAVLVSIAVTPAIPTIPLGTTQQFTATGTYTDGSTQNITATVQWNSDTSGVATISDATPTQGLASSVGEGTASISATSGSITGSTTITVMNAALVSIAVTPTTPSIAFGTMQQFTATGTFTDGSTQDLTSTATWSSDTVSAATISNSGLAQTAGTGTANITASLGGISSSTLLTVTPAALVSIAINPQTATIPQGTTQQFTATGTFTDGSTQDLTQSGHWSSTAANVATISDTANSAGLASTFGTGTTTIAISSGSISAQATLVVNPAVLASIAITPQNPTIALGTTQQFSATGTYTDGSTQDLTSVATWTPSDATVAIISNALGSYGLATSSGQGAATISATYNTVSSSTAITVSGPALVSIAITPASGEMPLGTSQQFYATGTYTDGSTQDLTASATWTSSQPTVAPVSATGLVAGTLFGTANISASSGSVGSSVSVAVTAPVLVSVSINPASASIADGTSQQFTATGTYSDGSAQDLTSAVSWSSSLTSVATIAAGGLATGAGVGTSTITAIEGSITASVTLTVGQPVLVSIAVTPAGASFALGTTQQLTATGTYSDGSTLVLTTSATWTTADSTVATVNPQGVVSSVAVGSTTATATVGSISGSTTLNISPAVLVSIAVTPAIPTMPLGTTQQFTATGIYTDGSTQNITGTVQWSSDTLTTAAIGTTGATTGMATSVGEGTTTITATSGSVTGSTLLTVTAAALVSIAIGPQTPTLALGTTQQFTATGTYTDGSTQNITSMVQWSSDTLTTATIGTTGVATGLATSVGQGSATITATSGSISESTILTVTAAALVSIAINPPTATIASGTTQQFTATGTFTDGTTQDLTQSGHWSSTAAPVATISNTTGIAGMATALTVGTTTIGISSGSVSTTATLVVNPAALVSITINPLTPTIALGTSEQFTATGTYTDGSTQDLTSVATWTSSNAMVAMMENVVGSYGLATSSGQGTAIISSTSNSISASTSITVGQASLTSIAVTPSSIAVALGYGEQFAATATYSDGSTQDITQSAAWTSSVSTVAVIDSPGYAASIYPGSTTITANSGAVSGSAQLAVNPAVAIFLVITPSGSSIFIGAQQQFTATLNYSDGSSINVTNSVTWSSLNPAVASVSSGGLAAGLAGGSSGIEASWGSNQFTATANVTVLLPTVSITPTSSSIAVSATAQFAATVAGNSNQAVNWSVDGVAGGNSTIGTISSSGVYTAPVLIGSHAITAVAQANSLSQASASITVGSLLPVASTFFGMHLHLLTSPIPATMAGSGRMWDSASAQWPNLNTASGVFNWTNLDKVLAEYYSAGINDVFYTLWRVPTWASSNPNDTACDYAASLGSKYYGECDLPTDLSPDGTGTNLTWRTWVQSIAQHVNDPTYLQTHAHIGYWEPCNECYRSPTLDPGYGSGGAQIAYRGTYAQLIRLMQDARCIVVGNPSDPITALNTTCGQAGYPYIGIDPTAKMVMPSSSPLQVGKNNPSYPQVTQNMLYCTCTNNSCSASTTGCTTGSAGSAAVDIISAHIYPNSYTPEQIPSEAAKVRAVLSATDLAKPFWDGEGGWGQNTVSIPVSDGDPDMEASFLARFLVMNWVSGFSRTYWYQWDNAAYGTLWSPTSVTSCGSPFTSGYICKAGTAYQQVYDWLVGSTLGSCSVTGTTWTCNLTQSGGSQAMIAWDTSQTCANGNCTSMQFSAPPTYGHYSDLTGAAHSIINGTVPVGIKPILLTQ